jgi:hypothetical protein
VLPRQPISWIILLIAAISLLIIDPADAARRRRSRKRTRARAPSAKVLAHQAKQGHVQQIRARGERRIKRANAKVLKIYASLDRMLGSPAARQRRQAAVLLDGLVKQSSTPGLAVVPRLYPRLHKRNHDRFIATSEQNLGTLLDMAARLAKGNRYQRTAARRMVNNARPQSFGSQVALMRATRALRQIEAARWAARQAFISFGPVDELVFERETQVSEINPEQMAEITDVLRTARGRGHIGTAYTELRRADSRYFGRTVATRLQAIAYLIRQAKGKPAARLSRELQKWQPALSPTLKAGPNDRWIPASFSARKHGRGIGRLLASALLARRR